MAKISYLYLYYNYSILPSPEITYPEIISYMKKVKKLTKLTFVQFLKLKYSWCTILREFQVYYIVTWHLHALWNDDHNKSSNHLSLYKVITILLTVFLMLYITSLWLIYFVTGGLYFFIPFTYFTPPPLSLLATTLLFSVSVSLFSFCFVRFVYQNPQYLSIYIYIIYIYDIYMRHTFYKYKDIYIYLYTVT